MVELSIEKKIRELRKKKYSEKVALTIDEIYERLKKKGEIKEPTYEVVSFANLEPFLEGGKHGLIAGQTGKGKTNLQIFIEGELLDRGFKVIHRDDGGEAYVYNMPRTETILWIPKMEKWKYDLIFPKDINPDYDYRFFGLKDYQIDQMIEEIYKSDYPYHVILYHFFDREPKFESLFMSKFLMGFIWYVKRLPTWEKSKLFLSCDQLNDILNPHYARGETSIRDAIHNLEYGLQNLRKHKVSLLISTHRFMDITKSSRFNFSYYFIKKMKVYEIWDWLSKELIDIPTPLFTFIVHHIKEMKPNQLIFFDEDGNYDIRTNPCVEIFEFHRDQIEGKIEYLSKDKDYDDIDLQVLLGRLAGIPLRKLAEEINVPHTTLFYREKKLLENPIIQEMYAKLQVAIKEAKRQERLKALLEAYG